VVEKEGEILQARAEKIMNDYEGKKLSDRSSYREQAQGKLQQ